MRTIIIAVTLLITSAVSAKSPVKSDLVLRECLSKVYSDVKSSQKDINANAKICRESVREMKKNERVAARKAKLQERIAKLQADLKKVN